MDFNFKPLKLYPRYLQKVALDSVPVLQQLLQQTQVENIFTHSRRVLEMVL